jgi:short-subunit dehydrogenase
MTRTPVLILGGRSDIGLAIAHRFAAEGHAIQLAARQSETLSADRQDIMLRHGVTVTLHEFDALDIASHPGFVESLDSLPDIVVCAVGLLGDQPRAETGGAFAAIVMRSNFEGPASILGVLANAFERRRSGVLVGISSVAGERGRASNYVYGSAKAGFTAFLSGLRNRLAKKGVQVVTVLPGFVDTRMTAGMELPGLLTATPLQVAMAVARAVRRGKDVVYVKPIWAIVMAIVRAMPERIFKRLSL